MKNKRANFNRRNNDALLRPTKAIAPNGYQIITEYGAETSEAIRFIKVKMQIDAQNWKQG